MSCPIRGADVHAAGRHLMQYQCDDCGRVGSPRMLGRILLCTCGSIEIRWLPVVSKPAARLERVEAEEVDDVV